MATPKTPKTAKKTETAENVRELLISEGFDSISVDSFLPLLGSVFANVEAIRTVLATQKITNENRIKAEKEEREKVGKAREAKKAEDLKALSKVFSSIGVKSVPSMMNDVRDEPRNSMKVLTKGGEKEKVHDRDLIGLRFTSGRYNFCFQCEVPFERLTGTDKYSMSKEEHAIEKERILGEIAKVILSNYAPDTGVFLG